MIFEKEFDIVIQCFNKTNVDYMIEGGYAVNFHGYSRNTSDLDIWINPSETNKQKINLHSKDKSIAAPSSHLYNIKKTNNGKK